LPSLLGPSRSGHKASSSWRGAGDARQGCASPAKAIGGRQGSTPLDGSSTRGDAGVRGNATPSTRRNHTTDRSETKALASIDRSPYGTGRTHVAAPTRSGCQMHHVVVYCKQVPQMRAEGMSAGTLDPSRRDEPMGTIRPGLPGKETVAICPARWVWEAALGSRRRSGCHADPGGGKS